MHVVMCGMNMKKFRPLPFFLFFASGTAALLKLYRLRLYYGFKFRMSFINSRRPFLRKVTQNCYHPTRIRY